MTGIDAAKRIGVVIAVIVVAAAIFGLVFFGLTKFFPKRDVLPTQLAREDEKTARGAAEAIGGNVEGKNRDATINIDLTTGEIRHAFDALPPPQPAPAAGEPDRPLPAAPVNRVRERLNQSIARANRAAGPAGEAD